MKNTKEYRGILRDAAGDRIWRSLALLILFSLLFLALPTKTRADSSPKPSLKINFENVGKAPCYAAVLMKNDWRGDVIEAEGGAPTPEKPVEEKERTRARELIEAYVDEDGFEFNGTVYRLNGGRYINISSFAPREFKVIVCFPKSETVAVTEKLSRYAFDSYYTVCLEEGVIDSADADIGESVLGVARAFRSYDLSHELEGLYFRVVMTVFIEVAVAVFFGFRSVGELSFLALVNIITQIILNILLSFFSFSLGRANVLGIYSVCELTVLLLEGVVFGLVLRKMGRGERSVARCLVYTAVANASSFVLGLCMAEVLPSMF